MTKKQPGGVEIEGAGMIASGVVLEVTAPGGPRRRAGMSFGKAPVKLNLADITEEEAEMLQGDPKLRFRVIKDEVEPSAE